MFDLLNIFLAQEDSILNFLYIVIDSIWFFSAIQESILGLIKFFLYQESSIMNFIYMPHSDVTSAIEYCIFDLMDIFQAN